MILLFVVIVQGDKGGLGPKGLRGIIGRSGLPGRQVGAVYVALRDQYSGNSTQGSIALSMVLCIVCRAMYVRVYRSINIAKAQNVCNIAIIIVVSASVWKECKFAKQVYLSNAYNN